VVLALFILALFFLPLVALYGATGVGATEDAGLGRRLALLKERLKPILAPPSGAVAGFPGEIQALRRAEGTAAAAEETLEKLRARIHDREAILSDLATNQKALAAVLQRHNERLKNAIKSAYLLGGAGEIRPWLSQRGIDHLARVRVYRQYVERARRARIEETARDRKELADLDNASREERTDLARLQGEMQQQQAEWDRAREARSRVLARLQQLLDGPGPQAAVQKQEQAHASRLVETLMSALRELGPDEPPPSASPMDERRPFLSRKGVLRWPVPSRIQGHFGTTGQGVRIPARIGSKVTAVAPGRVVFADWFRLLGFLAVVDHGDGYLTLYGHNQRLLRAAGDWVESNEVLALVGDTGGQKEGGVYFEIRHAGQAEDPAPWCKAGR
jgi:septal ring factor EnvC (AmiA/AmiB activator)